MASKYYREYLIPSSATETTIYTVPEANTAIIRSLRVTNANASAADITVNHYAAGDATAHLLQKTRSIGSTSTYDVFAGVPCILEAGDVLKVLSSQSDVTFYLSYLEVDRT